MGNVYISLDDEDEAKLRRLAQEKYGGKKGSLSEIVSEALEGMEKKSKTEIKEEFFRKLEEGVRFSYRMYKKRAEIYE
ncbi:MAG: hypothetical protein ACLFUZ_04020 [Candidatus Micrarchaeia archaeon]